MPPISESISARVNALASEASALDATAAGDATESDSASETQAGAPPAGQASEVESGSAASSAATTDAPDDAAKARATKHALLEEKLRDARERRKAQRLRETAAQEKQQAEADRKAAAEERQKWEALKTGNFKEAITAMGRDPRAVFEEMQEEAKLAGTPEAQMKRMQELFDKQIAEVVEPLKKRLAESDEEKKQLAAQAETARFNGEFSRAIVDPAYLALREEYDDGALLTFAHTVKKDLTAQGKRFTILDVLGVLKKAQDEHDAARQARRARLQASTQSPADQTASEKPTVNGTAERRNAGTTLGNDLASQQASGGRSLRSTRAERVRKLIDGG